MLCDSGGRFYRYSILTFLCVILLSIHYCVDLPGGLQNSIMQVIELDKTKYNLIFSSYTWPNTAMSLVGGLIVDRIVGRRKGLLIVSVVCLIGQSVFAAGAVIGSFWLIFAGRFVFGSGVGLTKSLVATMQTHWSSKSERSFVMSLGFSANRLGVTLALTTTQPFYDFLGFITDSRFRLGVALGLGVLVLVISLICCILVTTMDIIWEKNSVGQNELEAASINIKYLKHFPILFWLIITACGLYYSVIFSFVANGQLYLVSKFGLSINKANFVNSLVFASTIIITPLVGMMVSKTGHSLSWAFFGTLIGLLAHATYTLTTSRDNVFVLYLAPILYSISYSLFAVSMWPLPSIFIPPTQTTTAYGFATSFVNAGIGFVSLTTGVITDHLGYFFYELYNMGLVITALLLVTCSMFHNSRLEIPFARRKMIHQHVQITPSHESQSDSD